MRRGSACHASLPEALRLSLEARRHRPFFELWTIWGAFAPVGFDEGRAELGWRGAQQRLQLSAHGAFRRYDDTGAGVDFLPLRSSGWRTGLDASVAGQRASGRIGNVARRHRLWLLTLRR